jgi:CRP-like cAMP-binding protein
MRLVEVVTRVLQENSIFKELTPGQRELVAGCASLMVFQEGAFIYREGQPAQHFYLIRHGRVALEVHVPGRAPIIVDSLRDGDPLGWSWLIPPYRTHFDARALGLTRVMGFDAECLRQKMEENPAFGYALHKRMAPVIASRLAAARRQLIDIYGRPDQQGVAWR